MDLIDYFKQHILLPETLELTVDQAFTRETFPKGHLLLKPGNLSKKVFFIEKGLSRTFYQREDKDITHHFFPEDTFVMPIESIFYQQPAPYGLELLEESVIRSATYSNVEQYLAVNPDLNKFIRFLLIDVLKRFSRQLQAIQFQSARERYQGMIEQYPDILLRAPLGHIASYLGITQQTLSVIRARK